MKKILSAFIFFCIISSAFSQELKFTNCINCWNPDSLGNHRIVLVFANSGKYAKAVILWRRSDEDPQDKKIIIEDAKTKQRISNINTGMLSRESVEIYFEPVSGGGTYFVYYMPYKN